MPLEGDPANGPPTPTHSERLEADFRRGNAPLAQAHFFKFGFHFFIKIRFNGW